jgi:hypothetical protein
MPPISPGTPDLGVTEGVEGVAASEWAKLEAERLQDLVGQRAEAHKQKLENAVRLQLRRVMAPSDVPMGVPLVRAPDDIGNPLGTDTPPGLARGASPNAEYIPGTRQGTHPLTTGGT